MDEQIAKNSVIEAGKRLAAAELIARTWGNVSCRISASQFAVTPSGRAYDTLGAADIVTVDLRSLKHSGPNKPSSETGIHAAVYRLKPEINFVIHTHQLNASVVSALGQGARDRFTCAAYGLPGSAKLRRGVERVLEKSDCNAIIMAHHGALCLGIDMEDAFSAAMDLEKRCGEYIAALTGRPADGGAPPVMLHSGRGSEEADVLAEAGLSYQQVPLNIVFKAIYKKRSDIEHVIFVSEDDIARASREESPIRPLLDDMAQIVGVSLRSAEWDPEQPAKSAAAIVSALSGRHAVLVRGRGAFCCGGTRKDAEAVAMIVKKGCKAFNTAKSAGGAPPINALECRLMRWNYLKYYSRQAEKK